MSAHSAGPWNRRGLTVWCDGRIADVSPRDADGKIGEANAKLIAAAPDLLFALRQILPLTEAAYFVNAPTIVAARAAIAKATS